MRQLLVFSRLGRHRFGGVGVIVAPPGGSGWGEPGWAPTLPQLAVDVSIPIPTGTVYSIASGDTSGLQAALNAAVYGDVIELAAGGTWTGNFTFAARGGWTAGAYVLIRPSNYAALASAWPLESNGLPSVSQMLASGTNPRMSPSRAAALGLPLLTVPSSPGAQAQAPCLAMQLGAKGLYVWGVRAEPNAGFASPAENFGVFSVSTSGATSPDDLSSHFVLNQCVAGDMGIVNARRAVVQQGAYMAVVNSTAIAMDENFADSNAIWNAYGRGPFTYINNTEIANGENHFVGGVAMASWHAGVLPADFTFRHCHFWKPDETLEYHPDFAGRVYGCKNPWELKYGLRILLESCLADGNIANNQGGQSWSIKETTQNGANAETFTWCETGHVTMRLLKSQHMPGGLSIYAEQIITDGGFTGAPGIPTHDLLHQDCLYIHDATGDYRNPATSEPNNLGLTLWRSGTGLNEAALQQWLIEHNTWLNGGRMVSIAPHSFNRVVGRRNVWGQNAVPGIGIVTDGHSNGGALTTRFVSECEWTENSMNTRTAYPSEGSVVTDASDFASWPGNFFPDTDAEAGLNADGSLATGSPLKAGEAWGGTDGRDNGADIAAIEAGLAGVVVGL